ncbi:MAG: multiple sugar transport system permease protein [Halanaerobiales bacterium]|nr:multiple sugar transport system permease protein [Halanaerobiales bacterium]
MNFNSQKIAWALLAPSLLILIFIGVVPFVNVLQLSFFNFNIFSAFGKVFAGLEPYRELVSDPDFLHSLKKTLWFVIVTTLVQLPLGFFLASLLNRQFVGKKLFRSIFTLPLTIAPIAIGSIWLLMARPGVGPLPFWLEKLGINYNIGEFAGHAFATVVAMDVWHWTPFVTLTFLAGLSSMPESPYESAMIDGANKFQILRYITLPLLKPVIITILFIRVMDAFQIFDEVWMLTSGGPGRATRFLSIHLVRMVVAQGNYGYAATVSVFVLYIVIIICWLALTVLQRGEE